MTSKGLCGCIGILCSPKMATNAFENVCALKSKVKKEKKKRKERIDGNRAPKSIYDNHHNSFTKTTYKNPSTIITTSNISSSMHLPPLPHQHSSSNTIGATITLSSPQPTQSMPLLRLPHHHY